MVVGKVFIGKVQKWSGSKSNFQKKTTTITTTIRKKKKKEHNKSKTTNVKPI